MRHAEGQYSEIREVEWVTGAALFIRRELFEQLRGFDEEFFMFFEDKDLCLRARLLGAKVLYTPSAYVVHVRGGKREQLHDKVLQVEPNTLLRKTQESH